jgi:Do/DeqQ family serine protease
MGFAGAFLALWSHNKWISSENSQILPSENPPIVRTTSFTPMITPEGLAVDFSSAASASVDAVVHVKTVSTTQARLNPWLEMLGYSAPPSIAQGSGSGVIVNPEGFIVTNNHVIDGANEIQVSLNNNRCYPATIVGTDPATDLALLKIKADAPLPSVPFGDSESLNVGEWVLAVGNPFDLTSTVTAGIVSAKARNINLLRPDYNREIFPVESFIQTDAAVNPGNSGGALVNVRGELVGINTAIASKTGSYSGYSFAVPSSIVRKVSEDLMAYGRVQRAFLGVSVGDVNQAIAEELELESAEGVYVSGLTEVGGAEDAGMQTGDVILEIDGRSVRNVPELQERVSKYRPGDWVELLCIREGRLKTLQVELRDASGSTRIVDRSEAEWIEALGAQLTPLSPDDNRDLDGKGGVVVCKIRPGNLLDAGIREGFIITKVDGEEVDAVSDLVQAFAAAEGGLLIEGYYGSGKKAYYGVAARK